MNIDGSRTLVAGATGELGCALSRALKAEGAELALAGRDYLTALRRERRRDGLAVIDVRPPHMDTRFTEHALFGRAPDLPDPLVLSEVVAAILDALREDRREVAWDLKARELITA